MYIKDPLKTQKRAFWALQISADSGYRELYFFNVLQIDGSNRQKRPIYKSLIINAPLKLFKL